METALLWCCWSSPTSWESQFIKVIYVQLNRSSCSRPALCVYLIFMIGLSRHVRAPLLITLSTSPAQQYSLSFILQGKLWMDIGFWGGHVPANAGNLTTLQGLLDAGALGFKAFMSPSGGHNKDCAFFGRPALYLQFIGNERTLVIRFCSWHCPALSFVLYGWDDSLRRFQQWCQKVILLTPTPCWSLQACVMWNWNLIELGFEQCTPYHIPSFHTLDSLCWQWKQAMFWSL